MLADLETRPRRVSLCCHCKTVPSLDHESNDDDEDGADEENEDEAYTAPKQEVRWDLNCARVRF